MQNLFEVIFRTQLFDLILKFIPVFGFIVIERTLAVRATN